jgi:hypothetical protein
LPTQADNKSKPVRTLNIRFFMMNSILYLFVSFKKV